MQAELSGRSGGDNMTREEYEASLYLAHHGTKGMRWGIRKYQNEDGTLTPAGEARYAKKQDKQKFKEEVKAYQRESKELADKLTRSHPLNSEIASAKRDKEWHEKMRQKIGDGPDLFGTGGTAGAIKRAQRRINQLKLERDTDVNRQVSEQLSKKYGNKVIKSAETKTIIKEGAKLLASLGILAGTTYALSKIKVERPTPKIDPRRYNLESYMKYYV